MGTCAHDARARADGDGSGSGRRGGYDCRAPLEPRVLPAASPGDLRRALSLRAFRFDWVGFSSLSFMFISGDRITPLSYEW